MAAELTLETITAEVIPDDQFTVEFVGGGAGNGAAGDQGVVHSDLHLPWTYRTGAPGDGAKLFTDLVQADALGFVQQFGSGTARLDSDVSGVSAAGVGFGIFNGPITHNHVVSGRGQWISELAPDNASLVFNRAIFIGASGSLNPAVPTSRTPYHQEYRDLYVSARRMTGGSPEMFSIEGAKGVVIRNCAVDGRTEVPVSAGDDGYNAETGVLHVGTPLRIRADTSDVEVLGFHSYFAQSHGIQSSPTSPNPINIPRQIRWRGCSTFGSHKSGANVSNARDFVLSDFFFRNDIRAHGYYYSGYSGVRTGNGCAFFQYDTLWLEGSWRGLRIVDNRHFIAVNTLVKNTGIMSVLGNGKDTLNVDGTFLGVKSINAKRNQGPLNQNQGDDDEDEPEAGGTANVAMYFQTDGDTKLNGYHFTWGYLSSNDDAIYPGLGKITTEAGNDLFYIVDNSLVGQDFNGGSVRLGWLNNLLGPNRNVPDSTYNSILYYGTYLQSATVLGRAYTIESKTYFSGQNGTGSVIVPNPGQSVSQAGAHSSVSVCRFDSPCPISIGNMNDLSQGDYYRFRNLIDDPKYFIDAAGSISITLNQTAIAGIGGTDFVVEMGAAKTDGSRIVLYADNDERWMLGELASITDADTAAFIATGARRTYSGPFLWSIEQKVSKSFFMSQGAHDHIYDFKSMQFNGYRDNPIDMHPTALKPNQWPRSVHKIPSISLSTGQSKADETCQLELPSELLGMRGAVVAKLQLQPFASITGTGSSNCLKLRLYKRRLGAAKEYVSSDLLLTDVNYTVGGAMIEVPVGDDGPFPTGNVVNYFRMGSEPHGEVPDMIGFEIVAVGTGGTWPGGILYISWCPRWIVGA